MKNTIDKADEREIQHGRYQAPRLLPNHHTRPTRNVFWCSRRSSGSESGEERTVRPVAPELAARQEPVRKLVFRGGGQAVKNLVDPAKEAFVIEPFVTERHRRGLGHLVARV